MKRQYLLKNETLLFDLKKTNFCKRVRSCSSHVLSFLSNAVFRNFHCLVLMNLVFDALQSGIKHFMIRFILKPEGRGVMVL